jgi:hypothetical protein
VLEADTERLAGVQERSVQTELRRRIAELGRAPLAEARQPTTAVSTRTNVQA